MNTLEDLISFDELKQIVSIFYIKDIDYIASKMFNHYRGQIAKQHLWTLVRSWHVREYKEYRKKDIEGLLIATTHHFMTKFPATKLNILKPLVLDVVYGRKEITEVNNILMPYTLKQTKINTNEVQVKLFVLDAVNKLNRDTINFYNELVKQINIHNSFNVKQASKDLKYNVQKRNFCVSELKSIGVLSSKKGILKLAIEYGGE